MKQSRWFFWFNIFLLVATFFAIYNANARTYKLIAEVENQNDIHRRQQQQFQEMLNKYERMRVEYQKTLQTQQPVPVETINNVQSS